MTKIRFYFSLLIFFAICFSNQKGAGADDLAYIKKIFAQNAVDGKIGEADFIRLYSEARKINLENNFLTYFSCAMKDAWKPILEQYFHFAKLVEGFSKKTKDNQVPPIPEDIVAMSQKNDQWMNELLEKKLKIGERSSITIDKQSSAQNTTTISADPKNKLPSNRWKVWYPAWYRLVSQTNIHEIGAITTLQETLQLYKSKNPSMYKNDEELYARFAAQIARCYGIACAANDQLIILIHINSPKFDNEFFQTLFSLAPNWNIPKEAISFINVIRSAEIRSKEKNGHSSREHIEEPFLNIRCAFVENGIKENVCVPVLQSDECFAKDVHLLEDSNYRI